MSRALALACLLVGCVDADTDEPDIDVVYQADALRPSPEIFDFGTVRANTTVSTRVTLTNYATTDVDITRISGYPPGPCRINLLQPCVRPGGSTTLTLTCTFDAAGTIDFTTRVDYLVGRSSFALSIPAAGSVR